MASKNYTLRECEIYIQLPIRKCIKKTIVALKWEICSSVVTLILYCLNACKWGVSSEESSWDMCSLFDSVYCCIQAELNRIWICGYKVKFNSIFYVCHATKQEFIFIVLSLKTFHGFLIKFQNIVIVKLHKL